MPVIDLKTRYTCTWNEINAKIIARQHAQAIFVIGIGALISLVLSALETRSAETPVFAAMLAILPPAVALVCMIWVAALDKSIAVLCRVLRQYEELDEAADNVRSNEEMPKFFHPDQGWLDVANQLRFPATMSQAFIGLVALLPSIYFVDAVGDGWAWAALVIGVVILFFTFRIAMSANRYRGRIVNELCWDGRPENAERNPGSPKAPSGPIESSEFIEGDDCDDDFLARQQQAGASGGALPR